jgi:FAS-associated factor 2
LNEYLRTNFITWACSKNLPEGCKVFNALKARRCPFLGVIVMRHSRMNLVTRIEGPITAPELMLQLANIVADYEPELVAARLDREQRNQTQLLRQQQDQAYQESLLVDREKERKKQELAEAKKREIEAEKRKQDEEKQRINVK